MKEIAGKYRSGMKHADLHIHTTGSDGYMTPEQVVEIAMETNLSTIAITDHNTICSAYETKNLVAKNGYDLDVIIGTEINTTAGHFLALNIETEIHKGMTLPQTIKEIHRQGGLAIAAHPFLPIRLGGKFSLNKMDLLEVGFHEDEDVYLDGIEVFNAGVADRGMKGNAFTQHFYMNMNAILGAPIAGTDAHYFTIGRGITGYEGNISDAIKEKRTAALALDEDEQRTIYDKAIQLFGEETVMQKNLKRRNNKSHDLK